MAGLAAALLVAAGGARATAYEAVEIDEAGAVRGTVQSEHDGRTDTFAVEEDTKTCGDAIEIQTIEIGKDRGLAGAVVFLEDIDSGAAIDKTVHHLLRIERCVFEPAVISMSATQTVDIENGDATMHSVRGSSDGKQVFSTHLPMKNMTIDKRLRQPGLISVDGGTDRPWMRAWIQVLPHPYHAVTDDDGRFVIEQIPPGTYRLTAWHPELGTQTIEVEISDGATSEVVLDALTVAADTEPDKRSN
jgi:plastocyanin